MTKGHWPWLQIHDHFPKQDQNKEQDHGQDDQWWLSGWETPALTLSEWDSSNENENELSQFQECAARFRMHNVPRRGLVGLTSSLIMRQVLNLCNYSARLLQITGIISHHISQCCLFMPTGWPGGGVQGLFISRHFQRLGGGGRILISCWEGQTIELVGQLPHTLPPPFHTVDSHVLFK